jgi:hypothetical protein
MFGTSSLWYTKICNPQIICALQSGVTRNTSCRRLSPGRKERTSHYLCFPARELSEVVDWTDLVFNARRQIPSGPVPSCNEYARLGAEDPHQCEGHYWGTSAGPKLRSGDQLNGGCRSVCLLPAVPLFPQRRRQTPIHHPVLPGTWSWVGILGPPFCG